MNKVCKECTHARDRHGDSCYCVLYGIIIGYGKEKCRGFEREQVPEQKDGD